VAPDPATSFFGPPRGPFVPPGIYTITVSLGAASRSQTVTVEEDPRIEVSDADRKVWYEAARATARMWTRADAAKKAVESVKKQVADLQAAFKKDSRASDAVTAAAQALSDVVEPLAKRIDRQIPLGFAGAPLASEPDPLLPRARGLYLTVSAMTAPPTPQHRELIERVSKETDEIAAAVNGLIDGDVAAFNRLMLENGIGKVDAGKRVP
jgi:hypothetical protein